MKIKIFRNFLIVVICTLFSCSSNNENEQNPRNNGNCDLRLEITKEIPATLSVVEGQAIYDGIKT